MSHSFSFCFRNTHKFMSTYRRSASFNDVFGDAQRRLNTQFIISHLTFFKAGGPICFQIKFMKSNLDLPSFDDSVDVTSRHFRPQTSHRIDVVDVVYMSLRPEHRSQSRHRKQM
jgi:hypothetical protein